jgi:hypothetical protein
VINMEDNDDLLASNKTRKKWTRIRDGELFSYAGINFHKPIDEERLVKEIKRRKKLNDRKLDNNRKQAFQKRSIDFSDQLKQVEHNKKGKEFTNLKPGTYMTYKSRQYSEKDEHELMKAIIAQMKNYNDEQERKKTKNKEMNAKNGLAGIGGNVGDVSNNIDLVMAANTQESQEHNNNNYELCVDSNYISKNNIDIENNVEQDRWDYSNEYNEWEGMGIRNNDKPKQNRMLENYVCIDRIKNDEVANILLSFNNKNKLDDS